MVKRALSCLAAILSVVSCTDGSTNDSDSVDSTSEALAATGFDAAYLATTMKNSWYPGERDLVSVTMRNTGAVSPGNDWSASAPTFVLVTRDNEWGWTTERVGTSVAVNDDRVFTFGVTAPVAPGPHLFRASMRAVGAWDFGASVAIPVTVSALSVPEWVCTYLPGSSNVPTTLTPSENRVVTITVQNAGAGTWVDGFYLASKDTPTKLWSQGRAPITGPVASGETVSFKFSIRAPATPNVTYRLQREMTDSRPNGLGAFRLQNFCVDVPIMVTGAPVLDSTVVSHTFPSVMAPNEPVLVSVSLRNRGTESWPADSGFQLKSLNVPRNLWSRNNTALRTTISPAATGSLSFVVTAPSAPGNYTQMWQMYKLTGENAGLFGAVVEFPVVVDGAATPGYGSIVRSQSVPSSMVAGQTYPVSVVMKNVGTSPWQGSTFGLRSVSSPSTLWNTSTVSLAVADIVAPGAERTFTFNVKAPATTGTYSSAWRMSQAGGVGNFGETATTAGIAVHGVSIGTPHDCTELFRNDPSLADGIYTIDIDDAGSAAAFDVYCDMTNGGWTQINDQDVGVAGGFLGTSAWLAGVSTTAPNGGQWGVLNLLSAFVRTTGDFEFRMTYGQDESTFTSWVQSGDPLAGNRGVISSVVMVPTNQAGCGQFGGLAQEGGPGALDADPGGCWWFPVGTGSSFNGGIPAYDSSTGGSLVTQRLRLYVRR